MKRVGAKIGLGPERARDLLGMMDLLTTLIVLIVSWVYAHVQTHQIASIKHLQFFVYQLYLHRAIRIGFNPTLHT